MKYSNYVELLKEFLNEDRFNHSLCVARQAEYLANKYGADKNKAYLAGLLHDITKNKSLNQHLKILDEFGIILTDADKNPNLLHAISGSAYLKFILKIDDNDILNSVRYHTTGRANMSLLEKVVYLADFTSEDRNYKDIDIMRGLADTDIDKAIFYSLTYTINKLVSLKTSIHPDTVDAYNEIVIKHKQESNWFEF